jgi:murein DD-endopeptidase MepM/ murein hydrolase activator NlpD
MASPLHGLGLADARLLTPERDAAAVDRAENRREAAIKFEAYLAQIMVREMRKTVPDGMFGGQALQVFTDLLDQEVSERIAEGGRLGLADQLMAQMGEPEGPGPAGRLAASLSVPYLPGPLPGMPEAAPATGPRNGKLPVLGRISSRFGKRSDPFHGNTRHHHGIDIAAAEGSPIRAAEGGVVVMAGEQGGYGKLIVVEHRDGSQAFYAHCSAIEVEPGQQVRAGAPIGRVGQTGRATGPHLHFELRQGGEAVDPFEVYGW